ncbi:putative alkyl/aryl-sulfatase YjcS [Gigantopelta aegis]|uniref:putative alkyl/aryl-sulfatase YjcS n=1 Tax=Gigantopelta aegis TaxID=1735272 RepID=UPI001B88E17E|nr:putative alkyl/aryl-sulfatase YjcS [Gigantopelta aegis]
MPDALMPGLRMRHELKKSQNTPDSFEHGQNCRVPIQTFQGLTFGANIIEMNFLKGPILNVAVILCCAILTSISAHRRRGDGTSATQLNPPPQIVQAAENIWVAVGYALGNSIMIEGKGGVVIVDTTETIDSAQTILAEFRNITSKPIKAIIYTHNHMDHTFGAKGFVEDPSNPPDIYAHSKLVEQLQRVFFINPIWSQRSARQFGIYLPEGDLKFGNPGFIYPNKIFSEDEKDINVAGIQMTMILMPGETKDMIGLWLEKEKIFLPGDNLYRAFPNLYSIRGTPTRSTLTWVSSIDKVLELEPNLLIPSHMMPIHGWTDISSTLTAYRDAIQFVHDQTVRYMNQGLLPDEIADVIEMPAQLASHPYLEERYGTLHWSVKGVFDAYMGWFSGDPVELSPLTPDEKAKKLVDFGGGVANTVKKAEDAAINRDYQWALELSSSALRVKPRHSRALAVKADALMMMAETQTSVNGILYYKSCAAETLGAIDTKSSPNTIKTFATISHSLRKCDS